jgi:hypothetical protein
MPFHVQMRRSYRRAWAFNLDEQRLRRAFVEPWRRGKLVQLGDQEWDPRESTITILEGPELKPADLAHGRGWQNAERSARDVTTAAVGAPGMERLAVAVLAETAATERRLAELLAELGIRTIDWGAVRARLLAAAAVVAEPPGDVIGSVAVVVATERADPARSWLYEVGLALGALGGRAIVVRLGEHDLPPELGDLGVIRLQPEQPASLEALAERLQQAGRLS